MFYIHSGQTIPIAHACSPCQAYAGQHLSSRFKDFQSSSVQVCHGLTGKPKRLPGEETHKQQGPWISLSVRGLIAPSRGALVAWQLPPPPLSQAPVLAGKDPTGTPQLMAHSTSHCEPRPQLLLSGLAVPSGRPAQIRFAPSIGRGSPSSPRSDGQKSAQAAHSPFASHVHTPSRSPTLGMSHSVPAGTFCIRPLHVGPG